MILRRMATGHLHLSNSAPSFVIFVLLRFILARSMGLSKKLCRLHGVEFFGAHVFHPSSCYKIHTLYSASYGSGFCMRIVSLAICLIIIAID
jgi:hypothetical protein